MEMFGCRPSEMRVAFAFPFILKAQRTPGQYAFFAEAVDIPRCFKFGLSVHVGEHKIPVHACGLGRAVGSPNCGAISQLRTFAVGNVLTIRLVVKTIKRVFDCEV